MREADNDNEHFISIGLHAALILNRLQNATRLSQREDAPEIEQTSQKDAAQDRAADTDEKEEYESPRSALA